MARRPVSQKAAAVANGWRSGLEEAIGEQLRSLKVSFAFEEYVIPFTQPVKPRKYTPDFVLPNGIIIESKGRFITADRQKHLLVQAQHPDLDIRFVFSNPNQRISKQSATTYAAWCKAKGFLYAKVAIPAAWLKELPNAASIAALKKLGGKKS